MRAAGPSKCREEKRRDGEVQGIYTMSMTAVLSCATVFYYCSIKILYCERETVQQQQPFFLLRSYNSVTALVSSRDAFRQRERDYRSIFISVLQIYITTQAIRRRVESGVGTGSQEPNVFTTSLLYDSSMIRRDGWRGRIK